MEVVLIVPVVGFFIGCLYVLIQYNGLVALKNFIADAWANIDTELKRRHDLIPNLVATVKGYAAHEKEVLQQVADLRQQCMQAQSFSKARDGAETKLEGSLGRLLAIVESYPDLKADTNFLELQAELSRTENRIQAARRFYNGNVRDYRNKCQTFPSSVVASMFGFQSHDYFQAGESERANPDINLT
ncbi:LemA family protein [Mariniblastus sp.]|nr:LemA family protein [Mariniblastus sp.]